jgi:hypothetical protein
VDPVDLDPDLDPQHWNLRFQTQEKLANIWQVLTIQTFIHVGFCYLTFVHRNTQRNQYNGANLFKEICLRKAQYYRFSLKEEKPLQFMIPLILLPIKEKINILRSGSGGMVEIQ